MARDRYEEIVPKTVICTGEHPTPEEPQPVVFGVEPGVGFVLIDVDELGDAELAEVAKASDGSGRTLVALAGMAFAGAVALAAKRA